MHMRKRAQVSDTFQRGALKKAAVASCFGAPLLMRKHTSRFAVSRGDYDGVNRTDDTRFDSSCVSMNV